MGVVREQKKPTEIYSAYGYTIMGRKAEYEWHVFNREPEECITSITIMKGDKNLFNLYLGNNAIILNRYWEETKDNFLWWYARENADTWKTEKTIYSCLMQTNSLFNHQINQRKLKEKEKQTAEANLMKNREEKRELDNYCGAMGIDYYYIDGAFYIFKFNNEKIEEQFKTAPEQNVKSYFYWCQENPDKSPLKVIYKYDKANMWGIGNEFVWTGLDVMLEEIKQLKL